MFGGLANRCTRPTMRPLRLMAGVAGFEPTNAGVKVPCLTAWLHPNRAFAVHLIFLPFYFDTNLLIHKNYKFNNFLIRVSQGYRFNCELVLLTGLEPARDFSHYPLKVACLPISPQQHIMEQVEGIEPSSSVWQTDVITTIRHLHFGAGSET